MEAFAPPEEKPTKQGDTYTFSTGATYRGGRSWCFVLSCDYVLVISVSAPNLLFRSCVKAQHRLTA